MESTSQLLDDEVENISDTATKHMISLGFCRIRAVWANLFFGIVTVAGQVGQNVSLPLWIDSTNGGSANTSNSTGGKSGAEDKPTVDSYFVLSFSAISFVAIFGLGLLCSKLVCPNLIGEADKRFPEKLLISVGVCTGLSGVLIVFAGSGKRTAPYLQAILGNFVIPLTLIFRYIILRKKPTVRKLCCGLAVVFGLFVCLLPTIFPKLDPNSSGDLGGATGVGRVLWPICFMLAFLPAAVVSVWQEKALKMQDVVSKKGINLVYFLFRCYLYTLLTVAAFFWVDIIPGFGNVKDISQFGRNWWFGVRCFFGGADCSPVSGTRGAVFILMFVLSSVGGGNFLRFTEGATWLAIVSSLGTPLGFLFWTLFEESPFRWHPESHVSTWFSIGSLAVMVPAIYLYNTEFPPQSDNIQSEDFYYDLTEISPSHEDDVSDPLIVGENPLSFIS